MKLVLVTGGTGAIGPRVVGLLRESGYRVRVLVRSPAPDLLPADVELLAGDVSDPTRVDTAMRGVSIVVHLAAMLHADQDALPADSDVERVNCGGTENVVAAARRHGVERVVHFSSISVYGTTRGVAADESSPVEPANTYARTKLAAENTVLCAVRLDGQPLGTVLRLAAVYGSRVKGNYRRLVVALDRGRFIPIGPGTNRRTVIYDRDAARAALLAATHPAAAGGLYNASDGHPRQMREIIECVCQALGRRPPSFAIPVAVARGSAAVVERAARLAGARAPLRMSSVDKYLEDLAVDSGRIQAELGFVPKYDLAQGWTEAVEELRAAGTLSRSG